MIERGGCKREATHVVVGVASDMVERRGSGWGGAVDVEASRTPVTICMCAFTTIRASSVVGQKGW